MNGQTPSFHSLLICLVFFVSTAACLPASAGDQSVNEGPRTTVKFGDLDLNTAVGRRELLDRLSKAARLVCAEYASANWALGYYEVYSSCFRGTLAAAAEKIHHEQVSALSAAIPNTP